MFHFGFLGGICTLLNGVPILEIAGGQLVTYLIHGKGKDLCSENQFFLLGILASALRHNLHFLLHGSMISRADQNEIYAEYSRPGGWNGWNSLSVPMF